MNTSHDAAIRHAMDALADALAAAQAPQVSDAPDRLYGIRETCEILGGLGRSRLYGELASGRLKSLKVGRRRLIPASAIADYIAGAGELP